MYSGVAIKKFVKEMQNTKWGKDHSIICGIPEMKNEKKRLYKFVELGDQDTRYEIFMATKILNESQLRETFAEKIAVIDERLLADYGLTQQSKNFDSLSIGEIMDILNDVSNFNDYSYYLVEEINFEL